MRIQRTGGTGLIGGRLVADLSRRHDLTTFEQRPVVELPATRNVLHDLRRPLNPEVLPAEIDAVVHLAQSPAFREFPERALDVFAVNTGSTLALLDYARRVGVCSGIGLPRRTAR